MFKYTSANSLLLRMPQLPRPIFPHPSHQPRILQRVAGAHVPTCTMPHHRVTRVRNGPLGPSLAGHSLHTTMDSHKHNSGTITGPASTSTITWPMPPKNHKRTHQPRFHDNTYHQRCHLQRSDRPIPHHLQPGQCIRCCFLHLRCQLHSLGTNQEPVEGKGRTPARIPRNT